jgi:hypothetical protein
MKHIHGRYGYGTINDAWNLIQRFALNVIIETPFAEACYMVKDGDNVMAKSIATRMKCMSFITS